MDAELAMFEVSAKGLDVANSLIVQRSGSVAITDKKELVGVEGWD